MLYFVDGYISNRFESMIYFILITEVTPPFLYVFLGYLFVVLTILCKFPDSQQKI